MGGGITAMTAMLPTSPERAFCSRMVTVTGVPVPGPRCGVYYLTRGPFEERSIPYPSLIHLCKWNAQYQERYSAGSSNSWLMLVLIGETSVLMCQC